MNKFLIPFICLLMLGTAQSFSQTFDCPLPEGTFLTPPSSEEFTFDPKNGVTITSDRDSVLSLLSGEVVGVVENKNNNRFTVAVKHNDSTSVAYMYLLAAYVKKGDIVEPRQALGLAPFSFEDKYGFLLALWAKGVRTDPRSFLKCKE